jgi:hypothetical protein
MIVTPGSQAVNAAVRDISATGAKLSVAEHVELPPEFYIVDRKQRSIRKVLLRWRKKEFAGVEFCQSPAKPAEKQLAKDLENAWFV